MRSFFNLALCAAALHTGLALAAEPQAGTAAADSVQQITRAGEQASAAGPAEFFTGRVRVDPVWPADTNINASGGLVTFEPGARSAWHTHPAGQRLVVTSGVGLTQEWGKPMQVIRPGDVVWCPPGVKHWHGAAPGTAMTHLAVTGTVSALKTGDWHQMIDVNVKGVLNGVAAVLPEFLAQKSGHVIATSSVAGLKAYPGSAVYGGTKWFVRDFMEVLRIESAMEGTNIRTATIYPAAINTELLATISDKQSLDQMQGLYDTYGISPDRIANVVAFAIDQPDDTTINEFTVGPAKQPW